MIHLSSIEFHDKIKEFNNFHNKDVIELKESDGSSTGSTIEGQLRIFWGLTKPIQLKAGEQVRLPPKELAFPEFKKQFEDDSAESDTQFFRRRSNEDSNTYRISVDDSILRNSQSEFTAPVIRRSMTIARKDSRKRMSFHGHQYNQDTRTFVPSYGQPASLRVTSQMKTPDVVQQLLNKFCVENAADSYALFQVNKDGVTRRLNDDDVPLIIRVLMGPAEDEDKIFLMEKNARRDISQEVAQYMSLPEPVLNGFLEKIDKEEEDETVEIQRTHEKYKEKILELLSEKSDRPLE